MTPKNEKTQLISVPKLDPKRIQYRGPGAQSKAAGAILEAPGPNMPRRWLKIALNSPR